MELLIIGVVFGWLICSFVWSLAECSEAPTRLDASDEEGEP